MQKGDLTFTIACKEPWLQKDDFYNCKKKNNKKIPAFQGGRGCPERDQHPAGCAGGTRRERSSLPSLCTALQAPAVKQRAGGLREGLGLAGAPPGPCRARDPPSPSGSFCPRQPLGGSPVPAAPRCQREMLSLTSEKGRSFHWFYMPVLHV